MIDLGKRRQVRGFRYLARQDGGWNGALQQVEFYVTLRGEQSDPVLKTSFKKTKQPQQALCEPVSGRYVRLRILSEVNGGPWASISELGIVGD